MKWQIQWQKTVSRHKEHWLPTEPHEHAHTTLYFFHKDKWIGMHQTPYKGSIKHFSGYLIKHANDYYLKELVENYSKINKWTSDINIDNISSNQF